MTDTGSVLDIILYAIALSGIMMAIIFTLSQFLVVIRKSKYYELIIERQKARDEKIEKTIKLLEKILKKLNED
jgi:hypothetical protein